MKKSFLYSLFLIGITAVSSQIILIREFFTTFYGNELSVGFVLCLWLLGGALGSGLLGNLFADRINKKLAVFSSVQIALSVLMPCGIIFARVSRLIFGVGVGEIVSLPIFLGSSGVVLLPIAILLGFLFVLGCKILPERVPSVGIGRVYALEATGAMLGGAITSLVLIHYFGTLQIACILSGLNLLSAYIISREDPRAYLTKYVSIFLICAVVFLGISGGIASLDRKSLNVKWEGFTVLGSKDSIYGRTTVTRKKAQFNFFNNGLFLFSSHDPLAAEEAAHFPMASSPDPKHILLIGGGASEITNEILKYPVETVDYVELDPLIISFSKEFLRGEPFYRLNDPKVTIVTEDGRYFIKNTEKRYDVVIINLPNPYTAQINRFYTREFFKELKRVLNKNAVVGFSVTSSENYLSKEQSLFLGTLSETAKSEFSDVKIVPGDTAHFLLSNKKGIISLDHKEIASNLKSKGIDTFYVRDYYLFSKLSGERLQYLHTSLRSAGTIRRNMDFHPISYFYDMVLWSTYFSFKLSKFFMFFTKPLLLWLALGFFFVLFIIFFIRRRNKNFKKNVTLLALATTGLSEISFEILIILAFQIIYGYLYYKVGIIITAFMFGLSLGSVFITRRLTKIEHPLRSYIKIQVLVLIYPVLLLVFFKLFSFLSTTPSFAGVSRELFAILPFIAGFVGGMQYPLANKICFKEIHSVGKTAGTTYAVDLGGAFIGAFLLSAFFVPIVGIPMTCVLVTVLNAVSLILLLIAGKASSP